MPDCFERPMVERRFRVGGVRRDASAGLCGGFGWTAAGTLRRAVRLERKRTVAADQFEAKMAAIVLIWQLFASAAAHKSAAEKLVCM